MTVTRRAVLGAAVLAPLAAATGARAAQPQSGQQAAGFYRYKVGSLEVTAINDGFFTRATEGFVKNAQDDDVKKALAEAFIPQDKVFIPFTTLVVNTGSKLVLLDTGTGDMGPPTAGTWLANFKAAGFDPANVDTILISHFHGDHINGLRLKDGSARFPNAEVMVPEAEWAYWMDDAKMASAPDPLKNNFNNVRRVFGPMGKNVNRFAWDKEPISGITTIAAPGHTPGHTAFAIHSGNAKLIAMSDTTNNPVLFVRNPDWSAVFDMDGPTAVQSRRKLLDMTASERMQASFYHAAFPATGFIAKDGNRFQMVPVTWQPAV